MILSAAVIAGLAIAARAQSPADPPRRPGSSLVMPEKTKLPPIRPHADLASLRRLVKHFDFEDADRFPTEMPRDWYRLLTSVSARPGYPDFGTIELTDRMAHAGRSSLQFTLDGGSMAVALPPGIVRIFPGSRYRISSWIRTESLQRSGARVIARLYDKDGQPVGNDWVSSLIRSEGEWTQVQIDMPDVPAQARDLSLELELAQPSLAAEQPPRPVGDDVRGTVWFDDLEVWQVPSIRFTSGRPAQVFALGEQPELEVELRDLVSDELSAEITITNIDGAVVHVANIMLPGAGAPVKVPLPMADPGAYRASLAVSADGVVVARRAIDIAIIDTDSSERTHGVRPNFGLVLPAVDDQDLPLMRDLALQLDPDFAIIPAWTSSYESPLADRRIAAVGELVEAMLDRRIEPILAINTLPFSVASARHLDGWQALSFFGSDDPTARAILEPWLLTFGSHVERWQVGSIDSPSAVAPTETDRATRVRHMLDQRVAGPMLLLPALAERDDLVTPEGVNRHVRIPWAARPGTVAEYLLPWRDTVAIVTFELAPVDALPERVRVEDLALRALDAWRFGAAAMAMELPWRASEIADGEPPSLRAEALAWRQIGRMLSGRQFIAELPMEEGINCWIADGAAGPALIAWLDSARDDVGMNTMLGTGPVTVTDLFGRKVVHILENGVHRVALTTTPTIIEGIDLTLARMLASARFDPVDLESRRGTQDVAIVLKNPFAVTLSGTIAISDQADWDINPRQQGFSIPAGGESRIPVRVALPRTTTAGRKELVADIQFTAGESYATRVRLRTNLDWPTVEVERSWRFTRSVETGHVDVAVTVRVTNKGTEPIDLDAFAMAKGFTPIRKPILKLGSGETAARVFQFPEGARMLAGESIFAGVSELDGDRRIAKLILIPPVLPPVDAATAANDPAASADP